MRRRWSCPKCGDVRIAPGRLSRDDTRRYCLACSEKTGRLVEREVPALVRRATLRAAARIDARARRQTRAEQRREAAKLVDRQQREATRALRSRKLFEILPLLGEADDASTAAAKPKARRSKAVAK